jgi:hypothetical protein
MTAAIPTVEASVATESAASEMTSGSIRYGAEMSNNLRVSKAFTQASVNVTFCVWDFRCKSVNGAVRSLK